MRERGLCQQRHRLVELGERVDLGDALDTADRPRRDGHRADRLLVTVMADVDDAVALLGAHLHLVMNLGDERAHRVDDVAAASPCCGDDLGGRAVSREHDRTTRGNVGDVVDEHDALLLEPVDDDLVVDDLVVAVDGRFEGAHHPCQCLDRHLDTGAETHVARPIEPDRRPRSQATRGMPPIA